MNTCTSCQRKQLTEAFLYKGKFFKTCSTCLDARTRKRAAKCLVNSHRLRRETEIAFEEVSFAEIIDYISSKAANLEEDVFSFSLCIKLDDNILAAAHHNAKNMVKLIVDEIEGFDGYDWM
jgi:hypothetical protein